jgi:ubiquitin C-terminal hydrolase
MGKIYNINTWVEAPKNRNVSNAIRKFCIENNLLIHKLESVSIHRDFLDKMLGIDRETIYFHISGDYDSLNILKTSLENESKK